MNQIVPFQFETQEIRVIIEDDQPWWVLADVCRSLDISNASDTATRLEAGERKSVPRATLGLSEGGSHMILVSEPGLYRLIMRSDKPVAKRFQRWVFHEVLPSIRQTGSYNSPKEKLPTNFDAIRALVDAAEAHEARIKKVEGAIENLGAHEDFKSIKAYASIIGRKITTKESGELGRQATALSKQQGQKIGRQPDEAFGFVNTYHRDVLKQIFGEAS